LLIAGRNELRLIPCLASIHRQTFEGDRVLTGEMPPELGQ
jgi:hypothetical protein